MFYKKLNKGLIFALILSIAVPAHAWDIKGFFKNLSFNSLSKNQKTGVIAGVVAVCTALIGYAVWKNLKARAASSAWDEMIREIEVDQAGKAQDAYEEWLKQKAIAEEQEKQEEDKHGKKDHEEADDHGFGQRVDEILRAEDCVERVLPRPLGDIPGAHERSHRRQVG